MRWENLQHIHTRKNKGIFILHYFPVKIAILWQTLLFYYIRSVTLSHTTSSYKMHSVCKTHWNFEGAFNVQKIQLIQQKIWCIHTNTSFQKLIQLCVCPPTRMRAGTPRMTTSTGVSLSDSLPTGDCMVPNQNSDLWVSLIGNAACCIWWPSAHSIESKPTIHYGDEPCWLLATRGSQIIIIFLLTINAKHN